MTTKEAWQNLKELRNAEFVDDEEVVHYWELAQKLSDKDNENLKG